MKRSLKLALSTAFAVVLMGAVPSMASAQDLGGVMTKIVPSLEYQQADVREALRALFRTVQASYTIAPDVQGTITVSLKNVTFESALQNITRQVDATYRVEGGVVNIIRRVADTVNVNTGEQPVIPKDNNNGKVLRRIKIRAADPQFIAMMLGADKGNQNYNVAPERSTIDNSGGGGMGGFGGGGMGGGGFGGGGMGGGGFGGGGMGGFGGGGMGGGFGGGGMGGGGFGGRGGGGFGGGGFGGGGRGFGG